MSIWSSTIWSSTSSPLPAHMFGLMRAEEPPTKGKEMKLYEIAVILVTDGKSEIIVPPTPLIAANDDAAKLQAGRKIPRAYDENLGDMRVLIRPFA